MANRHLKAASLHVLPTVWWRNTWSSSPDASKPVLRHVAVGAGTRAIAASHPVLGDRWLYAEGDVPLLFTENETNTRRLFGTPNESPYVKDGINDFVIHGDRDAVNPAGSGTKAAAHYRVTMGPGQAIPFRLRLSDVPPAGMRDPFAAFEETFDVRLYEADEFYRSLRPPGTSEDAAGVMRQALAGMLWSKQYYAFDGATWLAEHGADPFAARRRVVRNGEWAHMVNEHVISMPDKWEYPWYAAWDLAFHAIAVSSVDCTPGSRSFCTGWSRRGAGRVIWTS